MSEQSVVHGFTEFSWRVGEGTDFAATLTCIPDEDAAGDPEWRGHLRFDNDAYNWKHALNRHDDTPYDFYTDWVYPRNKNGGTYLMNLLVKWHSDIVELFGRVREVNNGTP